MLGLAERHPIPRRPAPEAEFAANNSAAPGGVQPGAFYDNASARLARSLPLPGARIDQYPSIQSA